ncbi:MAG TPA: hypothetical protein VKA18_11895 [Alphaproteobacteria bacterium]|nr:hypothetical protein [Alphaproteobacteria bacterium]
MRLFLWPGDFIAKLAGLEQGSENRQILRMWANTVFWGTVAALILLLVLT